VQLRRHKIDILSPPSGQDDYGEPLVIWSTYKSRIWASKQPILGNEYFAALTTSTRVEVKFNTGYINDVSRKMRIKHNNDIYEILDVINVDSRNMELLYYCKLVN